MPTSRLSSAQLAIRKALAGIEPRWTLTGGAALAGFHLGHRTTRDLDLFWQGHDDLGDLAAEVTRALGATGFTVRGLRRTPAFARLHVESADGAVEVDLVADPVARVEARGDPLLRGREGRDAAQRVPSRSVVRHEEAVSVTPGIGDGVVPHREAGLHAAGAREVATSPLVTSSEASCPSQCQPPSTLVVRPPGAGLAEKGRDGYLTIALIRERTRRRVYLSA